MEISATGRPYQIKAELESFYSQLLRSLSTEKEILGQIFTKSQNKIQDLAQLLKVIDTINREDGL